MIDVAIIDDHPILRDGLRAYFGRGAAWIV